MSNPKQNQQPNARQPRKSAFRLWIGLILALAVVGAGYLYWERVYKAAPGPTASEESEPVSQADAESKAGPTSQTGSLVVQANVTGATVYLDGKRLGEAPQSVKELKPGTYQVRVEKEGYNPFEQKVQLAAKRRVLRAELASTAPMLRVVSNVKGATVRLDGKPVGSTPLELKDIEPGSYELAVSAEGFTTHTEAVDFAGVSREVVANLKQPESVEVKHKHGLPIRSCDGVLRLTDKGIQYDADHKDQFSAAFGQIELWEFKGKSLNLKIRDGRNYSFSERNEEQGALAALYVRVKAALTKKKPAT